MAIPKLSICVAVYNCPQETRECFESIVQFTRALEYEVIVVDDCSEPRTQAYLSSLGPPFRVLWNEENQGFAINNNRAAKESRGEWLVFLNNDTRLTEGWLEPMLECYRTAAKAGVVGNLQRNCLTGLLDHCGMVFGPDGMPMQYGKNFHSSPFEDREEFGSVTAACWLIKKSLFLDAGGFDAIFRNGCEDVDFCLRLGERGYRHWVCAKSSIWHHVSLAPGRTDHESRNLRLLRERWSRKVQATWTVNDKKRHAKNVILRHWRQPWRYHFGKLLRAVRDSV